MLTTTLLMFLACSGPPPSPSAGATDSGGDPGGVEESWRGLSMYGETACAFDPSGELQCLGEDAEELLALAGVVVELDLADSHACGLDAEGLAHCVGNDQYGVTTPPEGERFEQVVVGSNLSCGLSPAGAPRCWGWDQVMPDIGEGPFERLAMGGNQLCGLAADGSLSCEGGMSNCGDEVAPPGIYIDLDLGGCHAGGLLEDGSAVLWNAVPRETPEGSGWVDIAAGSGFTCVLDGEGQVSCVDPVAPEGVPELRFVEIAAGTQHAACGLVVGAGMECWGSGWE